MNEKISDSLFKISKGLVICYIITFILILIISFFITYTSINESNIPLFNTIIMITSIVIGSIYSTLRIGEKGWLNGAIIGVLYFLILLFLSCIIKKGLIVDLYSTSKFVLCLATGIIGGMIGINLK